MNVESCSEDELRLRPLPRLVSSCSRVRIGGLSFTSTSSMSLFYSERSRKKRGAKPKHGTAATGVAAQLDTLIYTLGGGMLLSCSAAQHTKDDCLKVYGTDID